MAAAVLPGLWSTAASGAGVVVMPLFLRLLLFPLAAIGWGLWNTLRLLLGIEDEEYDPIDREDLDDQDAYDDPDGDFDGDTGAEPDAGTTGPTSAATGAGGGQR